VTDRPTDRPRYCVSSNRPRLASAVKQRPNSKQNGYFVNIGEILNDLLYTGVLVLAHGYDCLFADTACRVDKTAWPSSKLIHVERDSYNVVLLCDSRPACTPQSTLSLSSPLAHHSSTGSLGLPSLVGVGEL